MERVLKYLKSGTDAKMNALSGVLSISSALLYKAYEFKCPCITGYNKPYALMVIIAPPLIFFFVGVAVSQYCSILSLECSRPKGNREKNKKVLRQLFTAMLMRALAAPVVWLLACLLDGKLVVCGFSESMDPEQFGGFADFSEYSAEFLLARVPCKNFEILQTSSTRKAISRFLKFLSQGIGYISIVLLIVIGAIARIVTPMLNPAGSQQVRYWSRYTDFEEKCFEETCTEYNKKMAAKCVKAYFKNGRKANKEEEIYKNEMAELPVETLVYVDKWYNCRPPIPGEEPPDQQML